MAGSRLQGRQGWAVPAGSIPLVADHHGGCPAGRDVETRASTGLVGARGTDAGSRGPQWELMDWTEGQKRRG